MRKWKLTALAILALALVVAPGLAMAKKENKTNNGRGIGRGGLPALRDRIAALESQLAAIAPYFEDADADGFNVVDGDCDDDPETGEFANPDASEIPGNDVDEDCDGVAETAAAPGNGH